MCDWLQILVDAGVDLEKYAKEENAIWAFHQVLTSARPEILVQRSLALHLGPERYEFDVTWTDTWFEDEDYKPMPGAWMDHHVDEVASAFAKYCCDHRITATMRGRAGGYYIPGFTDEGVEEEGQEGSEEVREEEGDDESEKGGRGESEEQGNEESEMGSEEDIEVDRSSQSEDGSNATPNAASVSYDLKGGRVICRRRS